MKFSEALRLLEAGKKITKIGKEVNHPEWHLKLYDYSHVVNQNDIKYNFSHAELFADNWVEYKEYFPEKMAGIG